MSETPATPETPNTIPPPAYFLNLTVQNFRCFGPEPQTLDLSDGNGKWANWTIILGENGMGKTTLLQCLIVMQPGQSDIHDSSYYPASDGEAFTLLRFWGMGGYLENTISTKFLIENLNIDSTNHAISDFYGVGKNHKKVSTTHDIRGLICYGYGAFRRMSYKSLADSFSYQACKSLYQDVELLNVEEWLIQIDYATKTKDKKQKARAISRLERIKTAITSRSVGTGLLPDVKDIRFGVTDDNAMTPRVEALTPYG